MWLKTFSGKCAIFVFFSTYLHRKYNSCSSSRNKVMTTGYTIESILFRSKRSVKEPSGINTFTTTTVIVGYSQPHLLSPCFRPASLQSQLLSDRCLTHEALSTFWRIWFWLCECLCQPKKNQSRRQECLRHITFIKHPPFNLRMFQIIREDMPVYPSDQKSTTCSCLCFTWKPKIGSPRPESRLVQSSTPVLLWVSLCVLLLPASINQTS